MDYSWILEAIGNYRIVSFTLDRDTDKINIKIDVGGTVITECGMVIENSCETEFSKKYCCYSNRMMTSSKPTGRYCYKFYVSINMIAGSFSFDFEYLYNSVYIEQKDEDEEQAGSDKFGIKSLKSVLDDIRELDSMLNGIINSTTLNPLAKAYEVKKVVDEMDPSILMKIIFKE
jgi:hypothetical protein